jgi:tRNA (guanine37-N1)-methyltransferase
LLLNVSGSSYKSQTAGLSLTKSLREILSSVLPPEEAARVHNSYDIVGDIAIVRLTEVSSKYQKYIAEAVMSVHQNVKTVLEQKSPVCGDFRVRELRHVAGENKTVTTHVEFGCVFTVDVSMCYFSPRLSHERMRVARQVGKGEVVVNMFAGVGCFSLLIAKYSEALRIHSIDVNPAAFEFMQRNVRLNGAYGRVIPIMGDAKEIIEARLRRVGQRVLMPLPEKALDYLPYALLALRGPAGWIHCYGFEHSRKGEDVVEKTKLKVAEKLAKLNVAFEFSFDRVVRSTGPNWYQVVLDIAVKV